MKSNLLDPEIVNVLKFLKIVGYDSESLVKDYEYFLNKEQELTE